ncbi:riboflavin synthase [Frigoribacterium faeni]|uniref:Riboflavin synthase n=1 Tax=Frigoribacterium faeni TaxID=145483 RepID=A0A7W3JFU7_9MICO|nr:riboflavin synthase [Frigoribacterium faeni]MBA8812088.1 riboflavin synthase [Frigoribacterium faeni]BFF13102.1 riboflavin synthase [Microbacterium flavescens]GEK83824.1 putative riboflavin synthase alpha chain [Frigoribacterium faeni]
MFTGLVEELGRVVRIDDRGDSVRLTVHGPVAVADAAHGDSISVSGVCLTVVEHDAETFTADVMRQTLAMSTVGSFGAGTAVNLERAARVGDRLGGHIVQGHVDGTARVVEIEEGDAWRRVRFDLADDLAPLLVDKGSVTLDGVSLTVSAISEPGARPGWFEVSLIPETLAVTTLGDRLVGDAVNVETDVLARHVRRMLRLDEIAASAPARAVAEAGSPS